jgi:DNA repair protein RecO (recombination protein O)
MATLKSNALVTRSMNWRDSSRIVTLFTREHGRIDVIAKGANRAGSTWTGILEPLNLIEAVVHFSDKRELQILGKAELESSLGGLKQDLERTGYALGILEILNTFFKDTSPAADFYDFVVYLLEEMAQGGRMPVYFWYFMLKLTSYLGFRPAFGECRLCGKEPGGGAVYFSFASGSVICGGCSAGDDSGYRLPAAVCDYLAQLQATHYRRLAGVGLPAGREAEVTGFLQAYLRYHTSEKLELKALDYYKI